MQTSHDKRYDCCWTSALSYFHKPNPPVTPSCTGIYICTIKTSLSFKTSHFFFQRLKDEAHTQTRTLSGTLTCRHEQTSGLQTQVSDKINRWLIFKGKKKNKEGQPFSIKSTIKSNVRREQREDRKPD